MSTRALSVCSLSALASIVPMSCSRLASFNAAVLRRMGTSRWLRKRQPESGSTATRSNNLSRIKPRILWKIPNCVIKLKYIEETAGAEVGRQRQLATRCGRLLKRFRKNLGTLAIHGLGDRAPVRGNIARVLFRSAREFVVAVIVAYEEQIVGLRGVQSSLQ